MKHAIVGLAVAFVLLFGLAAQAEASSNASASSNPSEYCYQLGASGVGSYTLYSRGCEPYNGHWTKHFFANESYATYNCNSEAYREATAGYHTSTITYNVTHNNCGHRSNGSYYAG